MSVYHLPTELLLEITTHLSIADARSFIQLSKYFNHILENELYLKALSYDDEEGLPLRSHVVAAYRWKLTALKRFIRLRPGINYTKVKTRPSKYADLLPELGSEEAATLFGSRGYLYPEEYGSATLLHIVSSLGQAEIIPLILEGRGDVTVTDSRSRTALHCAVWGGDVSTVQLLLDSGADVSVPAGLEPSPLLCAANSYLTNGDDPKIVKVLLDAGADALARTTDGATALHLTHSAGVAKLLLDACPDLLHCLCNNQIAPLDNIHNPLYPEDISVFLVESGGLIESPVAFHQSLLHSAAEKGHDRLVEALIKRDKTLLQKVTHRGETALHSAAADTRAGPKCARILIDAGIDIFAATTKYKETALHYAAKFYAGAEFFQALIQAGIDVEQRDGNGNTALHILFKSFAASNDIAPLLIAKSSIETLSSLNKEGESPLHYTARNCSDNTVRLLAAGVDPYLVNERGQTLLHRTRNIDTLTQLLEDINVNRGQVSKGANLDCQDKSGRTPLHSAMMAVVKHFTGRRSDSDSDPDPDSDLDSDSDSDWGSDHGDVDMDKEKRDNLKNLITIDKEEVFTAASELDIELEEMVSVYIVRRLLDAGADTSIRDYNGYTAMEYFENPESLFPDDY